MPSQQQEMTQERWVQIAQKLDEMPESARITFQKAAEGKGGAKNAIKAHCIECVGYQRREVSLCSESTCALYTWRPFQTNESLEKAEKAAQKEDERWERHSKGIE